MEEFSRREKRIGSPGAYFRSEKRKYERFVTSGLLLIREWNSKMVNETRLLHDDAEVRMPNNSVRGQLHVAQGTVKVRAEVARCFNRHGWFIRHERCTRCGWSIHCRWPTVVHIPVMTQRIQVRLPHKQRIISKHHRLHLAPTQNIQTFCLSKHSLARLKLSQSIPSFSNHLQRSTNCSWIWQFLSFTTVYKSL